MQETSVIQLDGESKVALVFGQMNEPPGARARVALTGVSIPPSFAKFLIPSPFALAFSPTPEVDGWPYSLRGTHPQRAEWHAS